MKRAELLRQVSRAAKARGLAVRLERQARHGEIFRIGSKVIEIPRHREIGPGMTFDIRRALEPLLGRNWWR